MMLPFAACRFSVSWVLAAQAVFRLLDGRRCQRSGNGLVAGNHTSYCARACAPRRRGAHSSACTKHGGCWKAAQGSQLSQAVVRPQACQGPLEAAQARSRRALQRVCWAVVDCSAALRWCLLELEAELLSFLADCPLSLEHGPPSKEVEKAKARFLAADVLESGTIQAARTVTVTGCLLSPWVLPTICEEGVDDIAACH